MRNKHFTQRNNSSPEILVKPQAERTQGQRRLGRFVGRPAAQEALRKSTDLASLWIDLTVSSSEARFLGPAEHQIQEGEHRPGLKVQFSLQDKTG